MWTKNKLDTVEGATGSSIFVRKGIPRPDKICPNAKKKKKKMSQELSYKVKLLNKKDRNIYTQKQYWSQNEKGIHSSPSALEASCVVVVFFL